ncbi:MAG: hypothetical protein Q4G34_00955 [Micrococcus sp.]|nr:hypothetical protein [Micrococcus sp.]
MIRKGRPSKGDRDLFVSRPHIEVGKVIRARAERDGYSLSEYIATVLANHVDRPDLAPDQPRPPRKDEELPLTG